MPTIPNTTVEVFSSGRTYEITPNEGYVLHNSARDWTDTDPITGKGTFYRGYSISSSLVPLTYDFDNTTKIDGYTAYGWLEIYARPIDEVKEGVF